MQLLLLALFFIFVYYFSTKEHSPYLIFGAFVILIILNDRLSQSGSTNKAKTNSNAKTSNANNSNAKTSKANNSNAKTSNAKTSNANNSNANNSNTKTSNAKTSNANNSNANNNSKNEMGGTHQCKDWESHHKTIKDACCTEGNCVDRLPLVCSQECADAVKQSFDDCGNHEEYFDIDIIEELYKKQDKTDADMKHIREYTEFKYMRDLCESFSMTRV